MSPFWKLNIVNLLLQCSKKILIRYLMLLQKSGKTNTAGECFGSNSNIFRKCFGSKVAAWNFGGQVYNYRVLIFVKTKKVLLIQCYCCCVYLSSGYRTASDANCWAVRTLFIALATSQLEESAPA